MVASQLVSIGIIISKVIMKVWLNDNPGADILGESILDIVSNFTNDAMKARKIARDFEEIGDKITENLMPVFETCDIAEDSIKLIEDEVTTTISNSQISNKLLAEISYNPKTLYTIMLGNSKEIIGAFTEKEEALYKRSLDLSAQYIVDIAPQLPNYTRENFNEFYKRFDIMYSKITKLLDRMQCITSSLGDSDINAANFERDYRNAVSRKYSKMNLFGANLDKNIKHYDLSISYVDLEISSFRKSDRSEHKITIDDAFKKSNVLFVTGEAGSGKTTLLQWLAINTASGKTDEKISSLRDAIPIVIELRKVKVWPINISQFINNIVQDITTSPPNNWHVNLLKSGQSLLLVDGLDEIEDIRKNEVLEWLDDLIELYKIKVVLTSRPSTKQRLAVEYLEIHILPMSFDNISKFIDYWHNAVLLKQELESKEFVKATKDNLLNKILDNPPIRKLATNPLLCAILCSLHYKRNSFLPSDRHELYEECCKMLIDSRDNERLIEFDEFGMLNYRQKKSILSELAYWMIKNKSVTTPIEDAAEHMKKKIANMNLIPAAIDAEALIKYFIDRSGIIREPENGILDFIHKTFQEYMAAEEASSEGDWGLLISKANDDSWAETIILAAGFANKKHADNLINNLIKNSQIPGNNKIQHELLAMACTQSAMEVSKTVRNKVELVIDRLIPPKPKDYKSISAAGDLAVPFLERKQEYRDEESISCIKVLSMISSRASLSTLGTYITKKNSYKVDYEISKFLQAATINEINSSGLIDIICQYVKSLINDASLELDYIFLKVVTNIYKEELKEKMLSIFKSLNKLKINNYFGNLDFPSNMLTSIETLELSGDFNSLHILNKCKRLKHLSINSLDVNFDFNHIQNIKSLNYLNSLSITINNSSYFNFDSFHNLKKISYLKIIFNEIPTGFTLSQLSGYTYIKKLDLLGELVLDLDIEGLNSIGALEEVAISCCSSLLPNNVFNFSELENIKKIVLHIDKYNKDAESFIDDLKMCLPSCEIEVISTN